MSQFVFRYENLLKLRMDEEENCKNQLALRNRELQKLQQELEELLSRKQRFLDDLAKQVSEGCSVQVLRMAEQEKRWLKDALEEQTLRIEIKERHIIESRKALEEAVKKRKILEKLKENDYLDFQQQVEAAEEQLSDQLTSFRDSVKVREQG